MSKQPNQYSKRSSILAADSSETVQPQWKPNPGPQFKFLQTVANADFYEIFYGGARGGGKRLSDDEQILTNSGWKLVREVSYNDSLVSIDGSYTKIMGIFHSFSKNMYKIVFDDGAETKCDGDHLWSIKTGNHGKRDGWIVRSTEDIKKMKDSVYIPTLLGYAPGKTWEGPDPYILGLILGDGTLTGKHTTVYSADDEIIDYLRLNGWNVYNYGRTVSMCQLVGGDESFRSILGRCIGSNKAVPTSLMDSDAYSRLALLQGLMDSDGSIDKEGRCTFSSISENLAKSVQFLCRSLGGKATVSIKRKISQKGGQDWYYCVRLTHGGKFNPFRLSRKALRVVSNQKGCLRTIISITKIENSPATCFQVEHPSNLYVIRDFVVTHNTDAGIMSLLYYKDHPLYRALVIRKNADDLKDWSDRAERWYCTQGAVKVGNPPEFTFTKGGKIRTGHLKDENAFSKYQGHEYHRILVEELPQIPKEENYLKLASSCRSTIPNLRPIIISTGNPDGPGFNWVRKRFGLHGIPTGPVITTDPETKLRRIFIPAKLSDNPALNADPSYKAFLDGLPDGLRQAWRDGSWDDPNIEGGYYTLAMNQARKEGRITQLQFNPKLKVHTVWDLGIGEQLVCGFFQKTKSGEIHLIDTWQGQESDALPQALQMLQAKAQDLGYVYGKHFAPHDATRHEIATGLTVIDSARNLGLIFEKIQVIPITQRIDRCLMMFPRLFINEPRCEQFISSILQYRKEWDEKRLDWRPMPLKDWTSHFSDMLSYAALVEDEMSSEAKNFSIYKPQYTPRWRR